MPFAAGVVLTSRPELLKPTFGVTTPYMPKVSSPLPPDHIPTTPPVLGGVAGMWEAASAAMPCGTPAPGRVG